MGIRAQIPALIFALLFVSCRATKPLLPSTGVYVTAVSRGPDPFPGMTDGDGLYVMTILSDRRVRIRHEEIRFEELGKRIEDVFRTRTERLLLVRVADGVDFGNVIEGLDRASSLVPLRYALITHTSAPTPAEPSLFMGGRLIYTQYFVRTPESAPPYPRRRALGKGQ